MAQPTNTFDSYDAVGIREDLADVINNVSPTDTPFYSACSKTTATNKLHEWQTDALRSSASNAHIEGDTTSASARSATTRLGNYTQIIKDAVVIPGSDDAFDKAGRADEMDYQMVKVGLELRLDAEKALLDNNARVAGNSTTARELAGVPAWLTTNTSTGATGADATGDGTDARTDGTLRNFTQTLMDGNLQSIYSNSRGTNNITCLIPVAIMDTALGFTGNNNQRATVPATENRVVNVVDVYMTPWGVIDFVMSREMRSRDVLNLNMDYWKVAVARDWQEKDLASDGDYEKKQLLTEITLESCNEASSGGVFDAQAA